MRKPFKSRVLVFDYFFKIPFVFFSTLLFSVIKAEKLRVSKIAHNVRTIYSRIAIVPLSCWYYNIIYSFIDFSHRINHATKSHCHIVTLRRVITRVMAFCFVSLKARQPCRPRRKNLPGIVKPRSAKTKLIFHVAANETLRKRPCGTSCGAGKGDPAAFPLLHFRGWKPQDNGAPSKGWHDREPRDVPISYRMPMVKRRRVDRGTDMRRSCENYSIRQ